MTEPTLHQVDPYCIVEDWWGEALSRSLIERVSSAPTDHVQRFLVAAKDEVRRSSHNALPPLPAGNLRPLVLETGTDSIQHGDHYRYIDSAARLLTYSHEAVIEEPFAHGPLHLDASLLAPLLTRLLRVRPLWELGALRFAQVGARQRHPSRNFSLTGLSNLDAATADEIRSAWADVRATLPPNVAWDDLDFSVSNNVGLSVRMVFERPDSLQAIARSPAEDILLRTAIANGARMSTRTQDVRLQSLARLSLPGANLPVPSLVTLRTNDALYADFRSKLGNALDEVERLPEGERWLSTATELVSQELRPTTDQLQAAVRKSPALAAAKTSLGKFSLSAIGSAAGAMHGGGLSSALLGGAVGKAAEAVQTYIHERQRQRADKAVLDIVVSFHS